MNKMGINEINYNGLIDIDIAAKLLENNTDIQTISTLNWSKYSYKPNVKFRIAYCQDQIWLKYYVTEENILAKEKKVNGAVYKDSCVEFFISPNQNNTYYNFEFNCIGTPHVGYRQKGVSKGLIAPEIIKLIKVKSSLGDQPFEEKTGGHQWEMMIIIPKECLVNDKNIVLKGLKANANFYKCGDDTSKPHFVTWNPVGTENPDYHQPAYMGEIFFK
ncbi:MAG: hypothetical protein L3J08_05045 [Flavobacteriaceae bacterium]|nr:hypothetical protein [Flavobacteriaceae bacterium]